MKILSLFLLIFSTLLLYNCEEPFSVVENQLIENIYLFDIDNKGSSADLCLTFTNTQTAQISSYRTMLIPEDKIADFDLNQAFLLAPELYTESFINSNESNVIYFKHQLDTEGDLIIPNKNYIAKVMMIGKEFNQLSLMNSNILSLTDQGILTGYYQGKLKTNISENGNFNNERLLTIEGYIKEIDNSNKYSGGFTYTIPNNNNFGNNYFSPREGSLRFIYSNGAISSLEGSAGLANYVNTYEDCLENCLENCLGSFSGTLSNDIKLTIIGEGCNIGIFELTLVRSIELVSDEG